MQYISWFDPFEDVHIRRDFVLEKQKKGNSNENISIVVFQS